MHWRHDSSGYCGDAQQRLAKDLAAIVLDAKGLRSLRVMYLPQCRTRQPLRLRRWSSMNPPIHRENLRDVLIALAVGTWLALFAKAFQGCSVKITPHAASVSARFVSSLTP